MNLTSCEMLLDDNRASVEIGDATYSRDPANWGTRIILTDLQ